MNHEEILEVYRKTEFMVRDLDGSPVNFRVCDTPPNPVLKGRRFAVITAWNPGNVPLAEGENRRRNRELDLLLRIPNYKFYPSVGRLGDHFEESFTVEDISEIDAVEYGKDFGQYAILYNDEGGARIVICCT